MSAPASNATLTGMPATLASIAPWTHALLRIGAGLLYMEHGLQKLFGMFGGMDGAGATVTLVSQMGSRECWRPSVGYCWCSAC